MKFLLGSGGGSSGGGGIGGGSSSGGLAAFLEAADDAWRSTQPCSPSHPFPVRRSIRLCLWRLPRRAAAAIHSSTLLNTLLTAGGATAPQLGGAQEERATRAPRSTRSRRQCNQPCLTLARRGFTLGLYLTT